MSRKNAKLTATILFFLLSSCRISSAQVFQPFQGKITGNDIKVRSDSTVGAEVVCALNKGDKVEVIAELYEWYKIRLPKNAPSYIKRSFLECLSFKAAEPVGTTVQAEAGKQCATARLNGDRVNIRLHPNTASRILGVIDKNEVVSIIEDQGQWCRIEPIANSFGYINKIFVTKTGPLEAKIGKKAVRIDAAEEGVIIIGTVAPYGNFFRRTASHKITTGDNKIFLLKADKKSLDAVNNKKVKVTGKIIDSTKEYPLVEVKILEVIN